MIDRSTYWAPLALALLSAGCSVFDESLIPVEDEGALRVGDRLVCGLPLNTSTNDIRTVDLTRAANDENEQPACVVRGLSTQDLPKAPGNDVYFRIEAQQGEKWHFHVREHAGVDPLIYVADRCDDSRSCADGINACGAGRAEHFSFIAASAGSYFVGIDSLTEGVNPLEVFAVNPICGNGGAPQHSEFCDDQNDDPTDGCHLCRRALQDGGDDDADMKNAFNDGPLDPTLLLIPEATLIDGGTFSVTGKLDTECDFDFFEFTLLEEMSVTVSLSSTDCLGMDLALNQPREISFLVSSTPTDCPLVTQTLEPGTHQVRVTARPTLLRTGERYTLTLALQPLP